MPFGFECNSGWYDIIYDLSSKLEPLIQKFIDENPGSEEYYPKAMQVKEKLAGLRFYMTTETDEMSDLISKAEEEAEKTCETCGSKENVSMRGNYWVYTACEKCYKKILDKQKKV
jgi:hypothetical protein